MRPFNTALHKFKTDTRGATMMVFGITSMALVTVVGLAIDGARGYNASQRAGAALDAAALVAAKGLNEQGIEPAALTEFTRPFFEANVLGTGGDPTEYANFSVTPSADGKTVIASVDTRVLTYFGGLANVPEFNFTKTATAVYEIRDIELALMLDVTGSMCSPCTKIDDLKDASRDLVDILVANKRSTNQRVRVALAPYAAAVNAGPMADVVVDPFGPRDGNCVIERTDGLEYSSSAPGSGTWIPSADPANPPADIDFTEGAGNNRYGCPSPEVLGLTEDAGTIKDRIDDLSTGGWTAGHIGLAWAWYSLAPEWASLWPTGNEPAPYDTATTVKAVVLMTDGIFNTAYANDDSSEQAVDLCDAIKAQDVVVFSVAFQAPSAAQDTLRDCRSPENAEFTTTYFEATNGTQLRNAFRSIATQLNNIRLSE